VVRALAALPPPQRETIVLRYYQDLSLEDIATALHIPLGTVKSRLSLGLKRLKAMLRDE
jgi:RNA polymerase sigma-70 factor (ECF subfamily)